ncbi:EAL domain-containing protein [Pseudomonas oryzihabitans]|uniref:Diguanylate cyclase (GGDEF)-like protein/PAS domain S-box-containing protein n=1 Tax=Pseudomonas oryzihabitans TaxID=47885 RepID=A0AAJ2BSV4_9PSED|nr:EAL domain-containing protein [Pseudomonas psychrotolerans]MDR6235702.1 diguanylate cyclase (GGDEF)-like protein/PAS domain S-box-containing protein [Pseudomonas psychrotolerans]
MNLSTLRVSPALGSALALCGVFLATSLLCIAFTGQDASSVPMLWLANGLAVAWLLRSQRRHWSLLAAAILVATVLTDVLVGGSTLRGLGFGLSNLAEVLFGAALLQRQSLIFDRNIAAMGRLLIHGVLLPPLLGASLGTLVTALDNEPGLLFTAVHWYIADALGLLVVLPLTFLPWPLRLAIFSRHGLKEFLALLLLSPLLALLILSYLPYPFVYLAMLLLVAAMRLTVEGTALVGGLTILLIGNLLTFNHIIDLTGVSLAMQALTYIPLALMQVPPLLLAAAVQQSRHQNQRLLRNQARYRHAMDTAPYGMALVSIHGLLWDVNPALEGILGYARGGLEGRPLRDLLADSQRELDLGEHEQTLQLRHRHGHDLWVMMACSPDHDDQDLLTGYLLQIRDIDAERRADELNASLRERLELAIRASNLGIWEWDTRSPGFNADARLRDLYGIAPDNQCRDMEFWLTFIHPDDRARSLEVFDKVASESMSYTFNFRINHGGPGGEVRHIRSELISVVGADGHVRLVGSNRDVTEHHQLTTALYEEKERLQVTLASIADAVLTTDVDGRILFLNPVAEQLTGWTMADARGRPHEEVFRIHDSQSDAKLPSPVTRCLREQTITSLDEGAVLLSRQGERHEVQDSAAPVRTVDGRIIGAVLVFQNVTHARNLQRELSYNASHDALTGLYNRLKFEQELEAAWQQAQAGTVQHALCFIDLDRFKVVNDSAGHAAGDLLLRELGTLLRDSLRGSDAVARIGGDEFALLLRDCDLMQAEAVAEKLIASIGAVRFNWQDRLYDVGASAGIVAITAETRSPAELMSQADVACYTAKHAGRNRAALYRAGSEDVERQHREILMASGLREALEQHRFELHAQPIVATRDSGSDEQHVELLLRLRDVQGQLISPATFIPAAERFGLMSSIDRWVVRQVLVELVPWLQARPQLHVGINLSGNSLSDADFLPELLELIAASPLDPQRLLFELTETAVINKLSVASQLISQVRERGCRIALDDFGAGLSSFTYLKNFRVDYVKIDGSFVRNLDQDPLDRAIVESINQVAHHLGAATIAEFVESQATFELLRQIGVDYAQGYALGKPIPLKDWQGMPHCEP